MSFFERYLGLWVALCIVCGISLGQALEWRGCDPVYQLGHKTVFNGIAGLDIYPQPDY